MTMIAEETRVYLNLLNKFGALTIEQIKKICEGTRFNPKTMINFLSNNRMIQILEDNYIVLQTKQTYSPESLYCLWVMLDKIKEENLLKSLELNSANTCDNGIELCFINKSKVIEYVAFVDMANIAKVSLIQDTFYTTTGVKPGNEDKCRRLYTFVVNDEEVMEVLAEMNLTIPFMVAYIDGELTDVPSIEYYQL